MRPFVFGQLMVVAGALTVSESASLPIGAVGAVLIFAGNVFSVPAFNAAVLDLAPESHRGTLIGLTVAVSGLGLAIGPAAGGFLSSAFGPASAFRAAAVVATFTVVGILAYARVFPAPRPAT